MMSSWPRDVHVIIRFADAEAKQAARIAQIKAVSVIVASDVLDDTDMRVDCRLNGDATVVELPDMFDVTCALCGDEIHQPSDAFPDDDRWFDSAGEPTCIANPHDNATFGPDAYGPHMPKGGADDAKTAQR